jgi:hypothetical protein
MTQNVSFKQVYTFVVDMFQLQSLLEPSIDKIVKYVYSFESARWTIGHI